MVGDVVIVCSYPTFPCLIVETLVLLTSPFTFCPCIFSGPRDINSMTTVFLPAYDGNDFQIVHSYMCTTVALLQYYICSISSTVLVRVGGEIQSVTYQ